MSKFQFVLRVLYFTNLCYVINPNLCTVFNLFFVQDRTYGKYCHVQILIPNNLNFCKGQVKDFTFTYFLSQCLNMIFD